MLWNSRDGLEYNKKNITINISSRTIKERQKNIINVTVMKIHFSSTKEVVYILCERVTRNLHHLQFTCFIDNLFTDSHLVRIFLIFNVDICDIIRVNALDIFEELKIIIVATKSQLKLKQWIHWIIDNINCFVWRDVQRNHVVTFDIIAYILEVSELTSRKSRFIIEIFFRNDARKIIVEQFIIAIQYNFYMSHVNRVNQLRVDLIISRSQQLKWIKRMIEYMIDSVSINVYLIWNHYQSNNDFSHRNRRVFTQKFIEKFLRSSDIIHQSSINIKSIYCV